MRFLQNRHYNIIITGVHYLLKTKKTPLDNAIILFLLESQTDYTTEDVHEIQTRYLKKYGNPG